MQTNINKFKRRFFDHLICCIMDEGVDKGTMGGILIDAINRGDFIDHEKQLIVYFNYEGTIPFTDDITKAVCNDQVVYATHLFLEEERGIREIALSHLQGSKKKPKAKK